MITLRTMVFVPAVFVLVGCDQSQQSSQQPKLGAEVAELRDTVKRLEENISSLQTGAYLLKARQERYDNTGFDPAEGKGYGKVETANGFFLVSLQDVTPHLDGVKIKLHIGNTQFATYNGFTIVADYGRRFPMFNRKGDPQKSQEERQKLLAAYDAAKREKSETYTQVLRPGTWNVVYLTLPDIKPEHFGHLTLSIVTNQVSLSGR